MSNYLLDCSEEEGLDYIFGKMGAIYGAAFIRHWDGVDAGLVRQVWRDEIGIHLCARDSMDYALKHMNPDHPPSALAFAKLCRSGPSIPVKTVLAIPRMMTAAEEENVRKVKEEALQKLAALRKSFG
jgi:hypothetical protein